MFYNIILLILPPHTSHLTQPLDVGIFSPLKKHLSAALSGIMQTEIARLQKVKWLEGYAKARENAFCRSNIYSAFNGAGLFPFCPAKVLSRVPSLPEPQTPYPLRQKTPAPAVSPLDHPLLTSSPADMNVFQAANEYLKDHITSNSTITDEEHGHINWLTRSSEKFFTHNNLREQENTALRKVIHTRKNRVAGTRGILAGQHCLTKGEIYAQLAQAKRAAEEKAKVANARKRKSKTNSIPNPSIDPSLLCPDSEALDLEDETS